MGFNSGFKGLIPGAHNHTCTQKSLHSIKSPLIKKVRWESAEKEEHPLQLCE